MTIQEVKSVYAAGMQAVKESAMTLAWKHDRKRDANFMAESEDYMVNFVGPCNVISHDKDENPIIQRGMVSIEIYENKTDREGTMHFDNPKKAIRFLQKAISCPKKALNKIDWYIVD